VPAAIASMVRMFAANVVSPNALLYARTATTPRAHSNETKVMNNWINVVAMDR
jgi:hypothetical protein